MIGERKNRDERWRAKSKKSDSGGKRREMRDGEQRERFEGVRREIVSVPRG